jgi:hypothetical protein
MPSIRSFASALQSLVSDIMRMVAQGLDNSVVLGNEEQ